LSTTLFIQRLFCTSTWGLIPTPVHMRPPEPDSPSTLRVDVINGWPLFPTTLQALPLFLFILQLNSDLIVGLSSDAKACSVEILLPTMPTGTKFTQEWVCAVCICLCQAAPTTTRELLKQT